MAVNDLANDQVRIRTLRPADIAAAMRLKQAAGWNQTYLDWRRFLDLEPHGGLAAEAEGRVVGTVTTFSFGRVSWIGMMLVEPTWRRQGIATRLMQLTLKRLDEQGQESVWLDATELGAPLYRQLGFRDQIEILRIGGCVKSPPTRCRQSHCVRGVQWSELTAMAKLDSHVAGASRQRLLRRLLSEQPDAARLVHWGGCLRGFVLDRPGSNARLIGPLLADSESVGVALLRDALLRNRGRSVFVDIPAENGAAREMAAGAGLSPQRQFVRMVRGRPVEARWPYLWASSGPEKG